MDRTESAIAQLAITVRDYLVEPGSDELRPDFNISLLRVGIPPPVLATKAHEEAVQLVLEDPGLIPLHPTRNGIPVTLTGSLMGTDLSLSNIPARIVGAAAFEVAVTRGILPVHALIECSLEHLHKMRQIADGETIEVRVLVGLRGFSLPEGVTCSTPLGFMQAVDPRMQGAEPLWTIWPRQLGLPPSVLLTTTMPYHIDVVQPNMPSPDTKESAFDDIPQLVVPVRLAVLLASDRTLSLVRPQLAQFTAVLPHGGAFAIAPGGEAPQVSEPRSLTDSEVAALRRFAESLAAQNVESIDIAMSRTLLAATERSRATDVLIDAVTAWENLVGTEAETSFRVTAALAQLLERDFELRTHRHRALKNIYGVRSKIVHGEHRKDDEVRQNADLAVQVAVNALRVILTDETWLLGLANSRERADALLLGDPRLRSR